MISIFLQLTVPGWANKPCSYRYTRVDHLIEHLSEKDGFTDKVVYKGLQFMNKRSVIDIYYTELESVSGLQASFVSESGKRKTIKDFSTRSVIGSSFYDGVRSKSFVLEPQSTAYEFSYQYTIQNSNLMFLSFLSFGGTECIDTISYVIRVPNDLVLKYEMGGDTTLLSHYGITHTAKSGFIEWTFLAVVSSRYPLPDSDHYAIAPASVMPGVRLSIVPASYHEHNFSYMNRWYRDLILPQSELNEESKSVIQEWGGGRKGSELIKALFDSVKLKINYIAFENGIGAVQPRNVNDVLHKRQGDCKDMANLLRQAIRYHGYQAWIAISSTLSHGYDLDFPSISSANHAICVAECDGRTYYLDATESYGIFGYPSRQIQGKYVLVVDSLSGRRIKVPAVPSVMNQVKGNFVLQQNGDLLSGHFSYTISGLSRIDIETAKGRYSGQNYGEIVKKYLASHFRNLKIDSLVTWVGDTSVIIKGYAEASNATVTVDNTTYLSQNILMFPHDFPRIIGSNERLLLYETMHREFDFTIISDSPVKLSAVSDEALSAGGFGFQYTVRQHESNGIRIRYFFTNENLEVNSTNRNEYNNVHQLITKTFSKKLAYE